MIIVYGAAGSKKSEVAENIISYLAKDKEDSLFYLATMENKSDAAKKRIKRHLELRKGKGFTTIEEPYDISKVSFEVKDGYVLVEDLSNLLANIYFETKENNILEQFIKLNDAAKEVVVVTNNIFEEGPSDDDMCDGYMRELARLNIELTSRSEVFVEVICGQEIIRKGERIWQ